MRHRSCRRRGQGAVELALMLPLLFAMAFAVIEFAFYFGVISWDMYAAYAGARALQVGEDPSEVADLLLDGNVTKDATMSGGGDSVQLDQRWETDLPFVNQLVGNTSRSRQTGLDFRVTVTLGFDESAYEDQIYQRSDNNMN